MFEPFYYFSWKLRLRIKEILFALIPMLLMILFFDIQQSILIFAAGWVSYVILISVDRDESLDYLLSLPGNKYLRVVSLSFAKTVYALPSILLLNLYYNRIPIDLHFNPNRFIFNLLLFFFVLTINNLFLKMFIDTSRTQKSPYRINSLLTWLNHIINYFLYFTAFLFLIISIKLYEVERSWDVMKIFSIVMFFWGGYIFSLRMTVNTLLSETSSFFQWRRSLKLWIAILVSFSIYHQFSNQRLKKFTKRFLGLSSDKEIINIIADGNLAQLKTLFLDKPDIRFFRSREGWNLVALAVHHGQIPILEFLAKEKVSIEIDKYIRLKVQKKYQKSSLLEIVTQTGNVQMMNYLDMNYQLLKKSPKNSSPMAIAAQNCHLEMLQYLIEKEVDVNNTDFDGNTPLMLTVMSDCLAGFILLLEKDPHLYIKNKNGNDLYWLVKEKYQFWYLLNRYQNLRP